MKSLLLLAMALSVHSAELNPSPELQRLVESSVQAVTSNPAWKLRADQVAVTLLDLRSPEHLAIASHRGSARIYPASVIKLFYLEAAHRWLEEGRIADTPELRRALKDMIVGSYNEATSYVVDLLTGTTSGPELPAGEMAEWSHKRNAINRYFETRGYHGINANQKPWGEGPYGRERIWVGQTYTNRNMLTTDATARLLSEIALGKAVSKKASEEMLSLLLRDPFSETKDPDDQSHGFTGPAVPRGAKLWSKAGWTSQTRHDAVVIQLANGARFVLVIFTVDHAQERAIIPAIAKPIIETFGKSIP